MLSKTKVELVTDCNHNILYTDGAQFKEAGV
jgi:hypothetical protein